MSTITDSPMEPLRAEHRELLPSIESLGAVAQSALDADPSVLATEVESALEFLREHLLIHALAEEDVLYPAVERVMGAPGATATMTREHQEVARLIEELAAEHELIRPELTRADRLRLVWKLHALHTLVGLHFAKEEEIYLPLLDAAFSVQEGHALIEEMEAAAGRHRAA